jgi:hypothetical protein
MGLLETNGLRIFSLSENTASVNAFSFWRDSKPFNFSEQLQDKRKQHL